MIDQRLIDFLKKELKNRHSEDFLRQGLITKGWPVPIVDESIREAKRQIGLESLIPLLNQTQTPTVDQIKSISEKPAIEKPVFDSHTITMIVVMFLIIAAILTFTSLVFFYMQGVMDYSVYDPVTQTNLKRTCIYQNCSDLRDHALGFAKQKMLLSIIIGVLTSLIIVVIYSFVSFKKVFLWIVQILFLTFLLVMGYLWFNFTRGPS